jgi:hypothetical protein
MNSSTGEMTSFNRYTASMTSLATLLIEFGVEDDEPARFDRRLDAPLPLPVSKSSKLCVREVDEDVAIG